MTFKEQLLSVLQHSLDVQREFAAGLSTEQKCEVGSYEKWSAGNALAHIAYWKEQQAKELSARARGEEPPPEPANYEKANRACFDQYCNCGWDEIEIQAEQAHAELADAVRMLQDDVLMRPAGGPGGRPLWIAVVNTAYTHALMHMADQYVGHGQEARAGQMWQDWGRLVAPLDEDPEWQGLVHYNVACGLALGSNKAQAVEELRQALKLRPSLTSWSRQDADLSSLHDVPAYQELYAPPHWWKAMNASPQAEALADQAMRTLAMLRGAIKAFPAAEWRKGDTPYQRPAGLALHALDSTDGYTALNRQQAGERGDLGVDWEVQDSSKLPDQDAMLAYLDKVDQRLAQFLAEADLNAAEEMYRWAGSTLLSRAVYTLRHAQHHLAEMCLELHRRGLHAPDWQ